MNDSDYEVALTHRADDDLEQYPDHTEKIIKQLASLTNNPAKGKKLSGQLRGTRSIALSIPVSSEHRAAYVMDKENEKCLVYMIGTRENFYDKAKRRVETLRKQDRIPSD